MSTPKVIAITSRDAMSPPNRDRPEPLANVLRDMLTERLGHAVRRMMEKVDDALFDLAEKSDSMAAQSLYFDAMREVRLKRSMMEDAFRSQFQSAYLERAERVQVTAGHSAFSKSTLNDLNMGLVDDEAMEEDIAVSNLVDKINHGCREQIYTLERRMAMVLGVVDAAGANNPAAPEVVCQAIRTALAGLQSGIKVRLIILKLFDRYVAAELEVIYHDCNQFLIAQGILPEIRSALRSDPNRRHPTHGSAQAAAAAGDAAALDEQAVIGALRSLLGLDGGSGGGSGGGGLPGFGPLAPAAIANSLGGLTQLQRGDGGAWSRTVSGEVAWAEGMRGEVNVLRSLKGTGITAGLGQAGDLTIDIVAMLFDYILDDRNIPSSLRALIGRLQIPVVKVAILDPSFFARKSHPARRLLNTLADASLGWSGSSDESDPLYSAIEGVVTRINREFEQDVGLFATLLDEFERFLAEGVAAQVTRTERTRTVLQGRERVEEAKRCSREHIGRHTSDPALPDAVRSFLVNHWSSVLVNIGGNHGVDSPEFLDAVQTLETLVASVQPQQSAEARRRFSASLPGLLGRLKVGMDRIDLPPIARKGFLSRLAKCHADAVRGPLVAPGEAATESPPAASPATESPAMATAELTQAPLPTTAPPAAPDDFDWFEATLDPVPAPAPAPVEESAAVALDERTQPLEATLPEPRVEFEVAALPSFTTHDELPEPEFSVDAPREEISSTPAVVETRREAVLVLASASLQDLAPATQTPAVSPLPVTDIEPEVAPQPLDPLETTAPIEALADASGAEPEVDLLSLDPLETTAPIEALADASGAEPEPAQEAESGLTLSLPELPIETSMGMDLASLPPIDFLERTVPTVTESAAPTPPEPSPSGVATLLDAIEAPPSELSPPRESLADVMRSRLLLDGEVAMSALVDPALIEERLSRSLPRLTETETAATAASAAAGTGLNFQSMSHEEILRLMASGAVDLEEVTLSDQVAEPTQTINFRDEHSKFVAGLETGTWIEFMEEDGSSRQARLTWINSATDVFMFTDRRGHKVADRTRNGLIADFRRGAAKVVEQTASFDVWVGRIMDGLGRAMAPGSR
jgi:hypothetical protein